MSLILRIKKTEVIKLAICRNFRLPLPGPFMPGRTNQSSLRIPNRIDFVLLIYFSSAISQIRYPVIVLYPIDVVYLLRPISICQKPNYRMHGVTFSSDADVDIPFCATPPTYIPDLKLSSVNSAEQDAALCINRKNPIKLFSRIHKKAHINLLLESPLARYPAFRLRFRASWCDYLPRKGTWPGGKLGRLLNGFSQIRPVHIGSQLFARHQAICFSLDVWAALGWDAALIRSPLTYKRRRYAKSRCKLPRHDLVFG